MDNFFAVYSENIKYFDDGYFYLPLANDSLSVDGRKFKKGHKLKLMHLMVPTAVNSGYSKEYIKHSSDIEALKELTWDLSKMEVSYTIIYSATAANYERGDNIKNDPFKQNHKKIYYGFRSKLKPTTIKFHNYIVTHTYINSTGDKTLKKKFFNWKKCFQDSNFILSNETNYLFLIGYHSSLDKYKLRMQIHHQSRPAVKGFYSPVFCLWVPPSANQKGWIKVDLSEHLLSKKRFEDQKSPYHFDNDIEWLADLVKTVTFPAIFKKYNAADPITSTHMFIFKSDRLEIHPGEIIVTPAQALVLEALCKLVHDQATVFRKSLIRKAYTKEKLIYNFNWLDVNKSSGDAFKDVVTLDKYYGFSEFRSLRFVKKMIYPYANKTKSLDLDNLLFADWSRKTNLTDEEKKKNITWPTHNTNFKDIILETNRSKYIYKDTSKKVNGYKQTLDDNWLYNLNYNYRDNSNITPDLNAKTKSYVVYANNCNPTVVSGIEKTLDIAGTVMIDNTRPDVDINGVNYTNLFKSNNTTHHINETRYLTELTYRVADFKGTTYKGIAKSNIAVDGYRNFKDLLIASSRQFCCKGYVKHKLETD